MAEDQATGAKYRLNVRLTAEELARFESVVETLQQRIGGNIKVTQKGAFLEALACLEARYDRLAKDRTRER